MIPKHLEQLIGAKITGIAQDQDDIFGLILEDGRYVWILMDEEGNGPGHLEIYIPPKG